MEGGLTAANVNNGDTTDHTNINKIVTDLQTLVTALKTGWVNCADETWVYVSATSFKISGVDATSKYFRGVRLRLKQGGNYKYFVVKTAVFSTDTTVTVVSTHSYSIANAGITDNYLSIQELPLNFPQKFTLNTAEGIGFSGWSGTPSYDIQLFLGLSEATLYYSISGTSNSGTKSITGLPVSNNSAFALPAYSDRVDNSADEINHAALTSAGNQVDIKTHSLNGANLISFTSSPGMNTSGSIQVRGALKFAWA